MNLCVQNSQYKTVERLVQTLKNLCCALDEVETQSITEAIKRLRHAANVPRTHSPKVACDPVVDALTLRANANGDAVFCRWRLNLHPLDNHQTVGR